MVINNYTPDTSATGPAPNFSYYNDRISPFRKLGLTPEMEKMAFSTDEDGSIHIHYLDGIVGTPIMIHFERNNTLKYDGHPDQNYSAGYDINYTVVRDANPRPNYKGKLKKYKNPTGTGIKIYMSAFFLCFIHSDAPYRIKRHKKLIVVEGQLKAWALCLVGIPAIGITGLTGALIAKKEFPKGEYKPTFKPALVELIKHYGFTELEYMQDQDNLNNDDNLGRATQFKSAYSKMQQATKDAGLKFSFSYPITPEHKGVDDLLTAKGINTTEVIKELKAATQKRPKFIQRHTGESLKAVEQMILRSAKDYRPLVPDAQDVTEWLEYNKDKDKYYLGTKPVKELITSMLYYDESAFNIIQLPTGKGKSTASIEAMQDMLQVSPNLTFLLIVPYHTLNDNLIDSFREKGIRFNNYNATKQLRTGIINIAVYDQLALMSAQELAQINLCIVDEIHLLYNECSYRHALPIVEHRLQRLNVIGLSATPSYSIMYADNLFKIGVDYKPEISLLKIDDSQHAIINQCLMLIDSSSIGLVRIKSAKECIAIRNFLREIRPNHKISFVCSNNNDDSHEMDFETKKALLKKGKVDCDLIISTNCIDCGVSIHDAIDTVICLNEYDIKVLIQIQHRSREVKSNVILLHSKENYEGTEPPKLEGLAYWMTKEAKALASYYNASISRNDNGKITTAAFDKNNNISFDKVGHEYFMSRCYVAKALADANIRYHTNNFDVFKIEVSKCFEIVKVGTDTTTGKKLEYKLDEKPIKEDIENGTLTEDQARTPLAKKWLKIKEGLDLVLGKGDKDNDLLKYATQAKGTDKVRSLKSNFRTLEYLEKKSIEAKELKKEAALLNGVSKALDFKNYSYSLKLNNINDLQQFLNNNDGYNIDIPKMLGIHIDRYFETVEISEVQNKLYNYFTDKATINAYGHMGKLDELIHNKLRGLLKFGRLDISKRELLGIIHGCIDSTGENISVLEELKEHLCLSKFYLPVTISKAEFKRRVQQYFNKRKEKIKVTYLVDSVAVEQDLYIKSEIFKGLDLTEDYKAKGNKSAKELFAQVQQYFKDKADSAKSKVSESEGWTAEKIAANDYQQYYDYLARPHSFDMTIGKFRHFLNLIFEIDKRKITIGDKRPICWIIKGLKTADYAAFKERKAAAKKAEGLAGRIDPIERVVNVTKERKEGVLLIHSNADLFLQNVSQKDHEKLLKNALGKNVIICPKSAYIIYREDLDTNNGTDKRTHKAKYSKTKRSLNILPMRPDKEPVNKDYSKTA